MKFEGKHGDYFWIEWQEAFLSDLIQAFPQIVINKYLINTSFDSGSLMLSDDERKIGWSKYNDLALSPPINDLLDIPTDQFDEWYVYNIPTKFENYEVFVNYGGFSLQNFIEEIQERFWLQIEYLLPEVYLAEGDFLIFVTRNKSLFDQVSFWQDVKH